MAFKQCRNCGEKVSTKAKTCPHCGAPVRKGTGLLGCVGLAIALIVVCVLIVSLGNGGGAPAGTAAESLGGQTAAQEEVLRIALAYLDDREALPDVAWWRVHGNEVIIGFDPWPADGQTVLNAAAVNGNQAINFGCHVYAVPAGDSYAHETGIVDEVYGTATARHGRLE